MVPCPQLVRDRAQQLPNPDADCVSDAVPRPQEVCDRAQQLPNPILTVSVMRFLDTCPQAVRDRAQQLPNSDADCVPDVVSRPQFVRDQAQ
jgi:hypothetical protein